MTQQKRLPSKIKAGDKITLRPVVAQDITVTSERGRAGIECFEGTDGESYHIEGKCGVPYLDNIKLYQIVSIDSPNPDNWPPVRGDVWKTNSGRHYHYIGDLEMRMRPSNGRGYEDVTVDYVKSREPVLAYREGL